MIIHEITCKNGVYWTNMCRLSERGETVEKEKCERRRDEGTRLLAAAQSNVAAGVLCRKERTD